MLYYFFAIKSLSDDVFGNAEIADAGYCILTTAGALKCLPSERKYDKWNVTTMHYIKRCGVQADPSCFS
jgi:hypothetical protein